jgi:hypothetical protein
MVAPAASRAPLARLTTEPNSQCKFEFVFFSSGGGGSSGLKKTDQGRLVMQVLRLYDE